MTGLSCGPDGLLNGDTAVFDLHLLRLGLWHMHGTGHRHTAPYSRMREAMAEADRLSRSLGALTMIVRWHNKSC